MIIAKRILLCLTLGSLGVGLAFAEGNPNPVLWSENFNDYELGDLPSQDPTWTQTDADSVNVSAAWPFTTLDPALFVAKNVPAGGGHQIGYAVKDISGEIASTDSQQIAYEFDTVIWSNASQLWGQETGYRVQDPCGVDIVYLLTRNTSAAGVFQINDVDIPAPRWSNGWNHFMMVLDFDAGMVDLYINRDLTPRVSAPLYGEGEFTSADIARLRFDAGVFNPNHPRGMTNHINNIAIWDARDWVCPAGDIDGDCFVDLPDFSILAANWLVVGREPNEPNAP